MGQAGAVVSAEPCNAVGKCSLELQLLCLGGKSSPLTPAAGGDSTHQPRDPLSCGMNSLGAQKHQAPARLLSLPGGNGAVAAPCFVAALCICCTNMAQGNDSNMCPPDTQRTK